MMSILRGETKYGSNWLGNDERVLSILFCQKLFAREFSIHCTLFSFRSSPSLSCVIVIMSFISLLFLPPISLVYPLNLTRIFCLKTHLLKIGMAFHFFETKAMLFHFPQMLLRHLGMLYLLQFFIQCYSLFPK